VGATATVRIFAARGEGEPGLPGVALAGGTAGTRGGQQREGREGGGGVATVHAYLRSFREGSDRRGPRGVGGAQRLGELLLRVEERALGVEQVEGQEASEPVARRRDPGRPPGPRAGAGRGGQRLPLRGVGRRVGRAHVELDLARTSRSVACSSHSWASASAI